MHGGLTMKTSSVEVRTIADGLTLSFPVWPRRTDGTLKEWSELSEWEQDLQLAAAIAKRTSSHTVR